MHLALNTLVSPLVLLVTILSHLVGANTAITATTVTSPACITVTSTNGGSCSMPTPCAVPDCLFLSSVTLGCGCQSIYTERVCVSTCPFGCGTTYQTIYIPCLTSFTPTFTSYTISSTSTPVPSNTSTVTVTSGSATSSTRSKSASKSYTNEWNGTETITCTSTVPISTTTVVITSTQITTITSCPAKVTCHGQTSSWTGTEGPYECTAKKTCTCVLPGGGNATLTGTGTTSGSRTPTIAGSTSTTSSKSGGSTTPPTLVQNNGAAGKWEGWAEGLMIGIFGLMVGGL